MHRTIGGKGRDTAIMASTGKKSRTTPMVPRHGAIIYSGSGYHSPKKYGKKDRRENKKRTSEGD